MDRTPLAIVLLFITFGVVLSTSIKKRRGSLGEDAVPEYPGNCPQPSSFGICVEQCQYDIECREPNKCCFNGCGHVCTPPGQPTPEPKGCPPATGFGICVNLCKPGFGPCPAGEMCCSNGCGHVCKKV